MLDARPGGLDTLIPSGLRPLALGVGAQWALPRKMAPWSLGQARRASGKTKDFWHGRTSSQIGVGSLLKCVCVLQSETTPMCCESQPFHLLRHSCASRCGGRRPLSGGEASVLSGRTPGRLHQILHQPWPSVAPGHFLLASVCLSWPRVALQACAPTGSQRETRATGPSLSLAVLSAGHRRPGRGSGQPPGGGFRPSLSLRPLTDMLAVSFLPHAGRWASLVWQHRTRGPSPTPQTRCVLTKD